MAQVGPYPLAPLYVLLRVASEQGVQRTCRISLPVFTRLVEYGNMKNSAQPEVVRSAKAYGSRYFPLL